jgi:hypothetical protein
VNVIAIELSISPSATIGMRRVRVGSVLAFLAAVFNVVPSNGSGGGGEPSSNSVLFKRTDLATRSDLPEGIVAADFSGDSILDLAVAPDGEQSLLLFKGLPNGRFAAVRKIRDVVFASAIICAADLDRDGHMDLITGNRAANVILVRKGLGALRFTRPAKIDVPSQAYAITSSDFNGDLLPDLAVAFREFNQLYLMPGRGDGSFSAGKLLAAGDTPRSIAKADFNSDGLDDVVIGNYAASLSIYLGSRTAGLTPQRLKRTPVTVEHLITADLNGDHKADITIIGEDSIVIYRGKGNGDFTAPKKIRIAEFVWNLAAGDFNNDSNMDIAYTNAATGHVSVLLARGNTLTYNGPFTTETGKFPAGIVAADFNSDSLTDVVTTNYDSQSLSVLLSKR